MDVYTEMRKGAGNSETVIATLMNLVFRLYNWRRWISHDKLVAKVLKLPESITRADMLEAFPTMCDRQLNALIRSCKNERSASHDTDHNNTMRMTMASKLAIDQI